MLEPILIIIDTIKVVSLSFDKELSLIIKTLDAYHPLRVRIIERKNLLLELWGR